MTGDTERTTQTTQLYERLRTSILTLDLLPGQSLAERGLEARFEASRTPVRAALVRLEAEGLVRRDGRSFAVAPIDLAEIGQLAEYREAVETAAVRLAVQRASDDDLDALADELTSTADANAAGESVQAGGDFHSRLAELAGNPFFSTAVAASLRRLERTRWLEASSAGSRDHARDEHLRILEAVRARDADRAAALIAEHIRGTHERLREALSSEDWRRAHAVS
ncbi:GntR family transcriptional regulator [Agreia pratensis]|uniref:Transcriptional regulator, GntR family n=1 Tax=Agreia pratensis TaxID=150121 RepID=A0A1X7JGC8_9MICO|nr:GntR family transcriptional regulator [Agreia pratensis]MBF4635006.1 GntR family transcriptional regulator [Agreia pratensis]SMG26752.1 transcriptional regulator, GntR family [Agreia pratensis]